MKGQQGWQRQSSPAFVYQPCHIPDRQIQEVVLAFLDVQHMLRPSRLALQLQNLGSVCRRRHTDFDVGLGFSAGRASRNSGTHDGTEVAAANDLGIEPSSLTEPSLSYGLTFR